MRWFKRLDRLSEPDEHLHSQEVRNWVSRVPGVEQVAVVRPRTRARVAGIVQSIKVVPQQETSRLEVEVYDGTDEITGVWWGRRRILGIELGRGIILEGTIGRADGRGLQMINPAYELLPAN
ncbi:MAG: OB-fold nucleic acid binding domain-containing protein [Acidimicrobiales bacterium]